MRDAMAVERSRNEKTGDVSVTYASIDATCSERCPLFSKSGTRRVHVSGDTEARVSDRPITNGCYARGGMVAMQERKLDDSLTPLQAARAEAKAVDGLTGVRPLRLHVSGDARTTEAARTLASAAAFYTNKAGMPVWTYTHSWREVARSAWGGVSVLASVHSVGQAWRAIANGYAPAMVVPKHESNKATTVDGLKLIPCPAQTTPTVKCTDCKLCWKDGWLHSQKAVITFAVHGGSKRKVAATCK